MKTFRHAMWIGAGLLMAGCATTGNDLAANSTTPTYDTAYVAAVEQLAQSRGVQVRWINPPPPRHEGHD